jgi:hypothetical protein
MGPREEGEAQAPGQVSSGWRWATGREGDAVAAKMSSVFEVSDLFILLSPFVCLSAGRSDLTPSTPAESASPASECAVSNQLEIEPGHPHLQPVLQPSWPPTLFREWELPSPGPASGEFSGLNCLPQQLAT